MNNFIKKNIVRFACQSLLKFKDDYEMGEQIFNHLFYDRTNDRAQLKATMELSKCMTLIGNPGEGKTCLMHNMFINTDKEKFYPIILDYRYCAPRKKETLIIKFVEGMKEYFKEIDEPLHTIAEETVNENYDKHHRLIQEHLLKIKFDKIEKSKKAVIFLDDLDYYEEDYIILLRQYFLPFALNNKTVLILSGRKPLINTISEDDELRNAFNLNPRKIFLVRVDLKTLFEVRISSVFPDNEDKTIFNLLNIFKNPKKIGKLLRAEAIKYLVKSTGEQIESEDKLNIIFGFDDLFWTHLGDATGRNLRQIENTLDEMAFFQWERENEPLNFNTDFPSSYIISMYRDPNYLLDLISRKTDSTQNKKRGNSILQIVLEYFSFHTMVNSSFYEAMETFGISQNEADGALNILNKAPYSLLDPDFVYNEAHIFRQYRINRKGKFYLDYIIDNELYYNKLTERFKENNPEGNFNITKSNKRYLLEV